VGFSIGLDRAMLAIEQRGIEVGPEADTLFVVAMEKTAAEGARLVRELRREFTVACDLEARGFGAQMKAAGKSGARLALILGQDEAARGEVALKDLTSGEQRLVPRASLREAVQAALRREGARA